MIALIRGVLVRRAPDWIIVDVGGVGYRLFIPLSTFYNLPEEEEKVSLHVYTVVREDALQLFGFLTEGEKELFEKLISVSKIGPRIGLNILSGLPAQELAAAIVRQDLARLSSIPGVGRKTAERLVVELRDRMAAPAEAPAGPVAGMDPREARIMDDVLAALVSLGYRRKEAERAVKGPWEEGERGAEQLIRRALAQMAK